MQHRVGVAIQPAGMEQRQHGQQHRRRRDIGRAAEIDAIPERHAMGDDRALGLAGGARGVHDGGDVIERDVFGRRRAAWQPRSRLRRSRRSPSSSVELDLAEFRRPRARSRRDRRRGSSRLARHRRRCNCSSGTVSRVFSGRNTAPSRPQANCTSSVSVVFSASTATRSPRALQAVAQVRGEPRNPRVELGVGESAPAAEIDHRQSCPACGGRNARSSRSSEPARLSSRSAV